MSAITIVFLLYLGLLAVLALWSRRETYTVSGYFIAGKKLPPWVVAFSTNATGESGWLLLGLTGMGYAVGVHAFWVVAGEIAGVTLAWVLVSRRLKRLGDETDSITVPDVLAAHFGDRWHMLRAISALIILLMVGAYVAAQMVASGKALSQFIGLTYPSAVLLGAVVIIGYTLVGGYKAVAWTDLVQGVLMWLGLIAVPVVGIVAAGGWDAVVDALARQDASLLDPWGPPRSGLLTAVAVLSFVAIGLGFLGVPQLLVRFMSAESERSLVPAMWISIFVILCFDIGAVLTGMAGRALFPGLEDQERIFPVLAMELFPPLISGVLMVVVLAAIMSTVDSLLILASSAVVRDFLQQIRGSGKSERALAGYGKWLTLVIGAVGVVFALHQTPLIFWFVLFAWNGLSATFGPVVLCMLWYRPTNLWGALAGMLGGFLTTMAWVVWFKDAAHGLLEVIPGFITGLVLTIGVSRATSARAEAARSV